VCLPSHSGRIDCQLHKERVVAFYPYFAAWAGFGGGDRRGQARAGRAGARELAAGSDYHGRAERSRSRSGGGGRGYQRDDEGHSLRAGLPLGAGRPLSPATRGVPQSRGRDGGCRAAGVHHALFPVPLGGVAAPDLSDPAVVDGQRPVRPVADQHAVERVQLHWAPSC
jgi:hypothetical protein